jgi:hypothetical protein
MYNYGGGSPRLVGVTFTSNTTAGDGGGIYNTGSSPQLVNVSLSSNSAANGGGYYTTGATSTALTNLVFAANTATGNGGGLYNSGGNLVLNNLTLYGNAANTGGGLYNLSANPTVANSIFWGNTATVTGTQIYNSGSTPGIANSDIQGAFPSGIWNALLGTDLGGNLDADPLFLNAVGGNLHLGLGSPAANVGDNTRLPADILDLDGDAVFTETVPYDRDGKARIAHEIVDLGAYEQSIWYVDDGGPTLGACTSWADACTSLQTALGKATNGDEIWVAAGTYTPGASGARTATFQLKTGIAIYGGFAGSETLASARDWTANVTLLSGDLDGSGTRNDNDAYHVVVGSGANATAALDGFTITGGYANGGNPNNFGAGLYTSGGSPNLENLIISGNQASSYGGGMYNVNGSPSLVNVTFAGNSTNGYGGGMYNVNGSPSLVNVTFDGNSASGYGGGMYNSGNSSLVNVIFSGNSAGGNGGGIRIYNSTPSLVNVTCYGNSAAVGGGIANSSANPLLSNSIVWGNTAPAGAQIYNSSSTLAIAYSDIQGAFPGGVWDPALGTNITGNLDIDPQFVYTPTADLHLSAASPVIDAGDNARIALDALDLDGDGIITETVPYDRDGNVRLFDHPQPDTGAGAPPIVDMGAYETLYSVPIVDAGPNQAADEGSPVSFTGSFTADALATAIHWDFGDGATASGALTPTHTYADNGVYTVTLTITDTLGGVGQDTLLITVANLPPVLGTLSDQAVQASTPLTITVAYSDTGILDTHTVQIDWGDGTVTAGVVDPISGTVSGSHVYTTTGTYTLTITLTDDDGGVDILTVQVEVTPLNHVIYIPMVVRLH